MNVIRLCAFAGLAVCCAMGGSLVLVRLAGYHVSGLGGWLAAVSGWGLAWALTAPKEKEKEF